MEIGFNEIAIVVLAAGAARRFGRPKQLEHWPEQDSPTLLQRAVGLALTVDGSKVYVVIGNEQEKVRELLAKKPYRAAQIIYNPRWEEGQGFSVAAGVEAVQQEPPTAKAILFMLADQPRLKTETLLTLLQTFNQLEQSPEKAIIFPVYEGKRGNPVLFGQAYFEELAALEGDTGGRAVVKAHPANVIEIAVDDPAICEDVDTPDDLEKLARPEK